MRRLPLSADEGRLLGQLDLAATLAAGAPRVAPGLLAELAGPLVVPSAERLAPGVAGTLAAFLDGTAVDLAAGPVTPRALLALDEGGPDDPAVDGRLSERLAFVVPAAALGAVRPDALPAAWRAVELPEPMVRGLAAAADALGVASVRALHHACQAAKGSAALAGAAAVREEDAVRAAQLVLAPRATRLPVPPAEEEEPASAEPAPSAPDAGREGEGGEAGERLVEAVAASVPAAVLALAGEAPRRAAAGRAGARVKGGRGRPGPVRAGVPGRDGRLALVETLTAAAPWRAVRGGGARVPVRKGDLRVRRAEAKAATLTVFCVDASGSQAYARMAEAKGAVEHLLAAAYVRRDSVAVVAFRKAGADVLLPPTSSLTRAKRALAALPGGGGTPLGAGIVAAARIGLRAREEGRQPTLVFLTDARANVTASGTGGREAAMAEALAAARQVRRAGLGAVVVDTGARPGEAARTLAAEMGARYAALPRATAAGLAGLVRAAAG